MCARARARLCVCVCVCVVVYYSLFSSQQCYVCFRCVALHVHVTKCTTRNAPWLVFSSRTSLYFRRFFFFFFLSASCCTTAGNMFLASLCFHSGLAENDHIFNPLNKLSWVLIRMLSFSTWKVKKEKEKRKKQLTIRIWLGTQHRLTAWFLQNTI